ncbi:MAG: hypothetical protein P1U39_03750 [Legionellaceae bacterium]|nr:hypothetical protein [Legionellaceae bacterium]
MKIITYELNEVPYRVLEAYAASFAYHIPQGSCLLYNPNQVYKQTVSRPSIFTLELASSILLVLGVKPPSYMMKPSVNIFK